MANIDRLDGGSHTARVSAAAQDRAYREQREADARRWLLARGLDDVAEILGLVPQTVTAPRRKHSKAVA